MAKRKSSRITKPNDGMNKPKMKAFRATKEINDLLNGVQNASEHIEIAILMYFSNFIEVSCPNCKGTGKIGCQRPKLKQVG